MKKSLSILLSLALGLSLVACANVKQEEKGEEAKQSTSTTSTTEGTTPTNTETTTEKTTEEKPVEEPEKILEGKVLEQISADTLELSLDDLVQTLKDGKENTIYGKKIALKGKLSKVDIPDGVSAPAIILTTEPSDGTLPYEYLLFPSIPIFNYIRYHGSIGEEYTFEIGTLQEAHLIDMKKEVDPSSQADRIKITTDLSDNEWVLVSSSLVTQAKDASQGKVLQGEEAKAVEAKENSLKLSLDDLYEKLQQNDVQSLVGKNILVDLILDDDVNYYYYIYSPFSDINARSEKQYPFDLRSSSKDEITQEKQFIRLEMPLSQEQHDYLAKEGKMGHHYTFELGVLEELQQLPDLAMSLEKSNILMVKTQSVLPNLLLPTISEEAKEAQKQGDQIKTKASPDAIEIKDLFLLAEKPEQLKELYGKTLVLSGALDVNASDSTMNIPWIRIKQKDDSHHFFGGHEEIQLYLGKNLASYFEKVQKEEREKQAKNSTYTPDATIYQIEFPQVKSIEITPPAGKHKSSTIIVITTENDVLPNLIIEK